MGTRRGYLGSAGLRESVDSCQKEDGETEVKSSVLNPGTFQTFQDVGASWGKEKADRWLAKGLSTNVVQIPGTVPNPRTSADIPCSP